MIESPKTVGIMQPYFLPFYGYFSHIQAVDEWIIFDEVKYNRKSWMNRNRFDDGNGNNYLITIPVTFEKDKPKTIRNADIFNSDGTFERMFKKLSCYSCSPNYEIIYGLLTQAINNHNFKSLVDLNYTLLNTFCGYLGIKFNPRFSSELDYNREHINHPGDWAYEISKSLGANVYLNPLSGLPIFDPLKFSSAGIDIKFWSVNTTESIKFKRREQYLSIVDTLFNCDIGYVKEMLIKGIIISDFDEAKDYLKKTNNSTG